MKKYILSALIIVVLHLVFGAQAAHAQYAYGSSGIGYNSVTRQVFGYSRTSVDYYAGAYYDPYVEGFLYSALSNYPVDAGADRGYENWIPAEVDTSTLSTPLTRYDVISDHYVISWYSVSVTVCQAYGFSSNCGYDPFGYSFFGGGWFGGFWNFFGPGGGGYVPERTYYLGSTGIAGITPASDPCGGSSGGSNQPDSYGYEYTASSSTYRDTDYFPDGPSACPSPTPTPPPIVAQVTEVGFTGDYMVKRFAKGDPAKQTPYDPDNATPTWTKVKNPDAPVAYQMTQQPTMFATLSLSPAPTSPVTARIQVKKDANIVATKDVSLSGANVRISDIAVAALENPTVVKRGDYKFTWEISWDSGSTWKPMGSSSHKIYWLYSAPITDEFTDFFGNTYDGLFDEALKHTGGEMGSGSSDLEEIILRITKGQANDIYYNPSRQPQEQHPLKYFSNRETVCGENSLLLRGLLRSIGIDGQVLYYYGGDTTTKKKYLYKFGGDSNMTFQILRPQKGRAPADPHFVYHSVVRAGAASWLYDASYGRRDHSVDFNETYCPTCTNPLHFAEGTTQTGPFTVENTTLSTQEQAFNESCPHEVQRLNSPNAIDDSSSFVAQQYRDFLRREPDTGGLNWWTSQITNCGTDTNCINYMRTQVARAFFLSREFQVTGLFVYDFYKASYLRQPRMTEFTTGQASVGDGFIDGTPGADAVLESNQAAFANAWVESDEFREIYDSLGNEQYVDTLFANIGVTPSSTERQSLLDGLNAGTQTRASVLRQVINNATFQTNENHPAFVLTEYFGYLQRNPDDPPDNDMSGYNFWLGQYNTYNDQSSMIAAFITSTEYRSRFGQP